MKTSTASARREGRRPPKICQKKMPHENLNGQRAEGCACRLAPADWHQLVQVRPDHAHTHTRSRTHTRTHTFTDKADAGKPSRQSRTTRAKPGDSVQGRRVDHEELQESARPAQPGGCQGGVRGVDSRPKGGPKAQRKPEGTEQTWPEGRTRRTRRSSTKEWSKDRNWTGEGREAEAGTRKKERGPPKTARPAEREVRA